MAPITPSPKPSINHTTQFKTPNSKIKLHYPKTPSSHHPSPNPNHHHHHHHNHNHQPPEHPVEVIARLRNNQDSFLQINHEKQNIRVRADMGYRDFSLDGISLSNDQDLGTFYKEFVQSRINRVKLGTKCTIMMYGPTGSGKSYTMFGSGKESGIVYRALKDILGDESGVDGGENPDCVGMFVQVTILEIYNEEIYDLLLSNGGGGMGPKGGNGAKAKLEVMGKKAKNATFLYGTDAGKISKEIHKVEKRRIVKSTLCNDRSSRSHCLIILDVPRVGGRLMLVDMAGSENIEQAGQTGFEAKMQTAKINQGNIALKRVVESIANGDSHVPFRDSKLTMLLQDSFEDDKSKILMILCANPDPKDMHKTICTLEYGAKAKCIIRGPHTPTKVKIGIEESSTNDGSRIAAMDQFISKLQMENKLREKEKNEAQQLLRKKEEEVAALRAKLNVVEVNNGSEEEINKKVNEQTQILKRELEKKLEECQRMAEEFVELERRRMEETILQQQEEVEALRRRLEEIELELSRSKDGNGEIRKSKDLDGIAKRMMKICGDEDPGMVKSMELDMDVPEPSTNDRAYANVQLFDNSSIYSHLNPLTTVYEEDEVEDEEVEKEIIQEKRVCSVSSPSVGAKLDGCMLSPRQNSADVASARHLRIQNIFTLCGNHRELSMTTVDDTDLNKSASKENLMPSNGNDEQIEGLTGGKVKDNKENCLLEKGGQDLNQLPLSPLKMNQLKNKLPLTPLGGIAF
ncbi:hypothetical protein ACFE04_007007 [Oxalis oulophora]